VFAIDSERNIDIVYRRFAIHFSQRYPPAHLAWISTAMS
jgi:hypothetical protein